MESPTPSASSNLSSESMMSRLVAVLYACQRIHHLSDALCVWIRSSSNPSSVRFVPTACSSLGIVLPWGGVWCPLVLHMGCSSSLTASPQSSSWCHRSTGCYRGGVCSMSCPTVLSCACCRRPSYPQVRAMPSHSHPENVTPCQVCHSPPIVGFHCGLHWWGIASAGLVRR